jgi:hypothetical protein
MKLIEQALLDFVSIFHDLKIPYAVMGGMAIRAYSIPRATWDVDVTIAIEREELPQLFEAVERAGYSVPEAYRGGWVDRVADMPVVKFRIYLDGGGIDVDVFIAEEEFQRELLRRRRLTETDIGPLYLVTPEDLVLLKLVAARPRDLIDVADLFFMQGPMDEGYLKSWGARLGVLESLHDYLTNPPTERP